MNNVVDLTARRNGKDDMLRILDGVTKRVHAGEVTGLVVSQTTPDSSLTYTSAAGICISYTMVGLLQATAVDISNQINDTNEDEWE